MGAKRAAALSHNDELVGLCDQDLTRAEKLAADYGGRACRHQDELLQSRPDAVVVAVSHDQLAPMTERALSAGAHVLVEKPAGLSSADVSRLSERAASAGLRVKVGFNHRFHPALLRLATEVRSGAHGDLMYLRARYGHGGRLGYEHEWRTDPRRSGGGELVDQGMHLLDLAHWLAGPLPLHCALLRTHFWDTSVEDNAALILGDGDSRNSPWAMLHVTWTEWKNTFSLEVYCQRAKLQVDGLVRSYGTQRLWIHRMKPELGPPDTQEISYPEDDISWQEEWKHFTEALRSGAPFLGELADARYAWERVEDAYASAPAYAGIPTTGGSSSPM